MIVHTDHGLCCTTSWHPGHRCWILHGTDPVRDREYVIAVKGEPEGVDQAGMAYGLTQLDHLYQRTEPGAA